jgi:hypothetical protein
VSQRTYGDTEALEDYTRRTLPVLSELQGAFTGYRRALHDALAAPSDLPIEVDDRNAEGEDLIALLTAIDQLPAAFAFALHHLDISTVEHNGRLPGKVANDLSMLRALAYARVDHPHASDHEVRAIAAATVAGTRDGVVPAAETSPHPGEPPIHWLDPGLTAAGGVAGHTAERHAADTRAARQAGGHDTATMTEQQARAAKRLGRATSVGGVVLGGVAQHLADAEDHNLTDGQRKVRAVTTATVDGLVGTAGAFVGGVAASTATGSPVGGAAGAVTGGELGTAVGGRIRRSGPVSEATGSLARSIDRRNGTGHRDDYTERLTLRTPP